MSRDRWNLTVGLGVTFAATFSVLAASCGGPDCPDAGPPGPIQVAIPLGSIYGALNGGSASKVAVAELRLVRGTGSNFQTIVTEAASTPFSLPSVQLGLNDPCFAGEDGGFGVSAEAFLRDLTDVQCRPSLLNTPLSFAGFPYSPFCTPTANGCAGPNSFGCDAGVAASPSTCTATTGLGVNACNPVANGGDQMGNPYGTFLALEHYGTTATQLFARFPDSVSTPSLSSGLVDLIGFGLFNPLDPLQPPPLSQSTVQCGINTAPGCGCSNTADWVSGWVRDADGGPSGGLFSGVNRLQPATFDFPDDLTDGGIVVGYDPSMRTITLTNAPNTFTNDEMVQALTGGSVIQAQALRMTAHLDQVHLENFATCSVAGHQTLNFAVDLDVWFTISLASSDGGSCMDQVNLLPLTIQPTALPAVFSQAQGLDFTSQVYEGFLPGIISNDLAPGFTLTMSGFCMRDLLA